MFGFVQIFSMPQRMKEGGKCWSSNDDGHPSCVVPSSRMNRGRRAVRLAQPVAEPGDVDPHVLAVEVHLLGDVPAFRVDGVRVREHGVVPVVARVERALGRRDLVGQVAQAEAAGRRAVVGLGGPVGAERDDLDECRAGAHEEEVRHRGAVHADHRVARVERAVHLRQLRVAARVEDGDAEAERLRGARQLGLVLDGAGAVAGHDHQPRLVVRRRRGGGPVRRLLLDDLLDAAAVRVVEHLAEVPGGQAAGRRWQLRGVDGELVVDAEADDGLGEAVGAAVRGEVDGRVGGELVHDVGVLGHPPVVVLEHDERHAAVEPARGEVERDDAVVELVVDVAGVAARGEDDGGDVVDDVAFGDGHVGGGRQGAEAELVDGAHDAGLPLAGVGPDALVGGGRGVEQEQRVGGGAGADVAAHDAHVGAVRRAVAGHGAAEWSWLRRRRLVVRGPAAELQQLVHGAGDRAAREQEQEAGGQREAGQHPEQRVVAVLLPVLARVVRQPPTELPHPAPAAGLQVAPLRLLLFMAQQARPVVVHHLASCPGLDWMGES
jgi:hypothetical protein